MVQNAVAALSNSHTDIHRAIDALKKGAPGEGKRLAVQAMHAALNAIAIL